MAGGLSTRQCEEITLLREITQIFHPGGVIGDGMKIFFIGM